MILGVSPLRGFPVERGGIGHLVPILGGRRLAGLVRLGGGVCPSAGCPVGMVVQLVGPAPTLHGALGGRRAYAGYGPVPVEGNHQLCLVCMKYRIIILIIIIISLGKIVSSYIANTPRTHACTDVGTLTLSHTPTRDRRCSQWVHPFRRWRDNGRSATHLNKQRAGNSVFPIVWFFSRIQNSRPI